MAHAEFLPSTACPLLSPDTSQCGLRDLFDRYFAGERSSVSALRICLGVSHAGRPLRAAKRTFRSASVLLSLTQSRHEARGGLSTTLLQGGGPSVGDLTILSRYYARDAHGTDKLAINKDRHATVIRDCPT